MNTNSEPFTATSHRAGVPPLAGVCTYAEAAQAGLSVEDNVLRLKRYNWIEQRLVDLVLVSLNSIPEWEVKGGLTRHLHLDADHAQWLQNRVAELRHPPHRFHIAPDEALEAFCREALRSLGSVEVLTALFAVIHPALLAAYRQHMSESNPLVDQPTRRWLRFIIQEEEEQLEWGAQALQALLLTDEQKSASMAWQKHLEVFLRQAGGIDGQAEVLVERLPEARALKALEPDFTPRRDNRVATRNYNFPPHWVYAQRERPIDERKLALICKRLLEMDVPEMMASIVWRTREEARLAGESKSWDYTADMARQMWDEVRHSMMGESWLVAHGIDWTSIPLNAGFSETLNSCVTPREAHAALYAIEQALMPATSGKAYEWRVARDSGDVQAKLYMDYDWADEVLHVHIGRHLTALYSSRSEAQAAGEAAFAKAMEVRRQVIDPAEGAWWPELVQKVLGFTPAPLEESDLLVDTPWKSG